MKLFHLDYTEYTKRRILNYKKKTLFKPYSTGFRAERRTFPTLKRECFIKGRYENYSFF